MSNLTLLPDDDSSDNIHRIERSSVIESGRHWRCIHDVEGIQVKRENSTFEFHHGHMYLLTRLEFFDGKLHSVVLLDDPELGTDSGLLTLDLFMPAFERVEDEAAIETRNKQIAVVQGKVAELQGEMAEAMVNPALMQPAIDKGLKEWEREVARQKNRGQEGNPSRKNKENLPAITTNGRFDLTAAISHKITSTDVEVFRHMAQREGKIAEIRAKWLGEKVENLSRVLKALSPFFSEQAAIGIARAQDALELSKDVEKGLRSLRLYTGDGVSVQPIIEGKSALSSEPLTVYQRKLFMDQEFAVWDDVDRLFDSRSSELFFKALAKNGALRQQLIPAQRGVVAMAVRADAVDYSPKTIGAALEADARNRSNKELFLLVRDGENWYQVFSDEPSHELSPRLFPTRNELDQIFTGIDGEEIGFEDLRFTNRATEFDHKSLAYKRFLILACGLDHRLKLFGDFYPDSEALHFISMRFQRDYMRFIADDDSDVMLGDNVGSVHQFIRHNHDQLAAGCRVLVFGKEVLQQQAAPGAFSKGTYNRNTYTNDYYALAKSLKKANLLTVRRDGEDLVVYLPVRRTSRRSDSGRELTRTEYDVRVALNKLEGWSLGYLLTDIVKAEELRPYIYSRHTRASHVDFIYGFKLAMKMLQAEEETNSPALAYLQERGEAHYGLTKARAEIAKFSAVQSWREKNLKEEVLPQPGSESFDKLDFELAEAAYALNHALPLIESTIEKLGGKLLRLTRGKRGALIAYYEQPDAERDLRIHSWGWVGRRTFTAAGKPTKDAPQTLWLRAGAILGESELMRVDSPFLHKIPERVKLEALQTFLDKTAEMAEVLSDAFTGERQGVSDRAWLILTAPNVEHQRDACYPPAKKNEPVLFPLGVDTATRLLLGIKVKVHDLLYHYGSDAQRAALLGLGYTLPAPRMDEDGNEIPTEGISMYPQVDEYAYPSQYTGPVGNAVGLTFGNDYRVFDHGYTGERRLDHSLAWVMEQKPRPPHKPDSFCRDKWLDPATMWFPAQYRDDTGGFTVSRLFPDLVTA